MDTIVLDREHAGGAFKPLNATNGGPWHKRYTNDQHRSNFEEYKAARIPYARNHDSALHGIYGGPYSHDISCIFPRFDADECDPASYDFACTDEAILCALDAGTKTFFRLGQTIEHQIKKHNTLPPQDFHKWARICEHIIRHYTEGWADGFTLDMDYWEIWNEPDLDPDDSTNKRCWGGTEAQFFDFYEIAAKHLKGCFPHLKIGGPALAGKVAWAERFLKEMRRREVPIDFFSWHIYDTDPSAFLERGQRIKALLVENGYGDSESILNEWNYVRGWREDFKYSILAIHGIKGAAFTMAIISEAQASDTIDMLMYYDTRPSAFCGVFDFYSYEPLKGYYPLLWYGSFYDLERYVPVKDCPKGLYALCGEDASGKLTCVLTHYAEDDSTPAREVTLDIGRAGRFEAFLLDETHDGTSIGEYTDLTFTMPCHSCILLKEV